MIHILIVEDEKPISELLRLSLTKACYHCTCVYDGIAAADIVEKEAFDLILLDVMLPGVNGFELMEYIRAIGTPVIFLTAKNSVNDRVKGLRMGAEDYIVKPFEILELLVRMEKVMERNKSTDDILNVCGFEINLSEHRVKRGTEEITLKLKEFDLLVVLAQNKNTAVSREQLLSLVWGSNYLGETRTVDVHIGQLRKKLNLHKEIVTVPKIGYRLED